MMSEQRADNEDMALVRYVDGLLADRKRPPDRDEGLHLKVLDPILATTPLADPQFKARLQRDIEVRTSLWDRDAVTNSPYRLAALRVGVLVLAIAVLSATPWGRSFAQQLLSFFNRAETDIVAEQTAHPPKQKAVFSNLAEAEAAVGFPVKTPQALPEGYVLEEIRVNPSEQALTIFYHGPANQTPVMTPMVALTQRDSPFNDLVGPNIAIEVVDIGGHRGEYVKGGWMYEETEGEGGVKEYRWEETFVPAQTLRWMSDDFYFELSFLGSDTQPGFLDKNDLIKLAESLN